jgi:hypothetical protein
LVDFARRQGKAPYQPIRYTLGMRKFPFILLLLALLLVAAKPSIPTGQRRVTVQSSASSEVRKTAKKLATAWIDGGSLDQLAYRTVAFSGMTPDLDVVLDGKRLSATQIFMDSALSIIGQKDERTDATAIRNIVYALTEIADGRATKRKR